MADHAGAAGAVDHVERLAEVLLQQRRDDARGRIGAAAGAPGANNGDGRLGQAAWARTWGRPSVVAAPAAAPPINRLRRVYRFVIASSVWLLFVS